MKNEIEVKNLVNPSVVNPFSKAMVAHYWFEVFRRHYSLKPIAINTFADSFETYISQLQVSPKSRVGQKLELLRSFNIFELRKWVLAEFKNSINSKKTPSHKLLKKSGFKLIITENWGEVFITLKHIPLSATNLCQLNQIDSEEIISQKQAA
jgi:hypothetical protein